METDLNRIKKLSEEKEDENWKFRSFLKVCNIPSEKMDSIVHRLYHQVASKIDCGSCANCCKELNEVLDQEDLKKLSKCLEISIEQLIDQYLTKDTDLDPKKFTFKKRPCPLLKNNLCSIPINYRPKDCVSYPYLLKKDFTSRLMGVIGNCSVCPIVFNVYELLKGKIWHKRFSDEFSDFY
jgi:hypothetical protein